MSLAGRPLPLAAALLLVAVVSCARPPRWSVDASPSPEVIEALLEGDPLDTLARDVLPAEVVKIPIRKRLRPCCAFGAGLKVRVGAVPVPGFRLGNITQVHDLGPHIYDSGALTLSGQIGAPGYRRTEKNGLVYTCRGGFIDTAHVRDYIDWTAFLATQIARNIYEGVTIPLPSEGGERILVVQPIDPAVVDRYGLARVALRLAEWAGFQLSIWHEIATWYGWSWVKTFPETASAFSPEDLYSNLVGVKIMVAIGYRRGAETEYTFNNSAEKWIEMVLEHLEPVPREVGAEAMHAVDQHWWDSSRRLPDKELTLRRNMDVDELVSPWLVPPRLAPESLRALCGDDPRPVEIRNPEGMVRLRFADFVNLLVEVDDNLAAQEPFTELGRRVSTNDFPHIVAAIREQNREEFGPDADRPD